jgi:hypothetical protein
VALPGFTGLQSGVDGVQGIADFYYVVVDLEGEHVLAGEVLAGALQTRVLLTLFYWADLESWGGLELGFCWFCVGAVELVAVL